MRKAWDVALGYEDPWLSAGSPVSPRLPEGEPPRAFQYTPGVNMQMVPRSTELIPFQMLRNLSEYSLVRIVIERIKESIKAHEWDIVADDENLNEQYAEDIATVKELFELPDRRQTWDTWIGQLLEDLLVIDAPAIYARRTYDGRIWGLELVDGSTIKVLVDDRGYQPMPPAPAYQQYLYGTPSVNLTADELIYRPRNVRPGHFYGFSPVEQILMIINMGMRREFYNLAQFTDGNIPAAFLKMPEDWSPQQIKQYMEYVNAVLSGDPQARSKFFPIPGGTGGVDKFRDDEIFGLHNTFDEWIARIICYAFGMSPTTFIKMTNRSVSEEMGDVEAEQGFASVKLWVSSNINWIIDHVIQMPHLRFIYVTDRARLKSKVMEANVKNVACGIKQLDEVRRDNGDAPLGLPPGIVGPSGFIPFPIGPYAPQAAQPVDPATVIAPENDPSMGPGGESAVEPSGYETPAGSIETTPYGGAAPAGEELSYAAAMKLYEKARLEELGKWERWAVARIGAAWKEARGQRPFVTAVISGEEQQIIRKAIDAAKTPDDIRHLFSTRRMHKRPLRIKPPAPREASQFATELKAELKGYLNAKVRDVLRSPEPSGEKMTKAAASIPMIEIHPHINVEAAKAPIINLSPQINIPPMRPTDVRVEVQAAAAAAAPVVKVDNVVNVPAQAAPTITNEITVPPSTVHVEGPAAAPLVKSEDPKKRKKYLINRDADGRMTSMEVTEL